MVLLVVFFYQSEDGIRDAHYCLECRRVLFRSVVVCDLADPQAVMELVRGTDAIVHLGGVSVERPFEEILPANIQGTYNIYEAARVHGVRRIVFASSNHVTGFYRQGEEIGRASCGERVCQYV